MPRRAALAWAVLGVLATGCKDSAGTAAAELGAPEPGGIVEPDAAAQRTSIPVRELGTPPSGIAPALWDEIGWFPAPVASISEFTRPESAAVVQWLSSVAPRHLACNRALYAVHHYFLVKAEAETVEPTHVLFGTSARPDVEGCATMLELGSAVLVRPQGPLTLVRVGSRELWLGWMTMGERTVIIVDRDRKRVEAFLEDSSIGIGGQEALVQALRHADRDADTWSAAVGDGSSPLVDVPSVAHGFSLEGLAAATKAKAPIKVAAWARFATEDEAERAHERLDAVIGRHETEGSRKLSYAASRDHATVHATVQVSSMAQLAEIHGEASRR